MTPASEPWIHKLGARSAAQFMAAITDEHRADPSLASLIEHDGDAMTRLDDVKARLVVLGPVERRKFIREVLTIAGKSGWSIYLVDQGHRRFREPKDIDEPDLATYVLIEALLDLLDAKGKVAKKGKKVAWKFGSERDVEHTWIALTEARLREWGPIDRKRFLERITVRLNILRDEDLAPFLVTTKRQIPKLFGGDWTRVDYRLVAAKFLDRLGDRVVEHDGQISLVRVTRGRDE